MKLPKIPAGYSLAIDSISASFADDTGNEHPMFLVSTEDDGGGAFLRLKLDAPQSGIVMNADELIAFAGIGSECYVAVELGRRAIGVELKESYYRQAVANMKQAGAQMDLFGAAA
jgi:adenine specific DNA methylase Mod